MKTIGNYTYFWKDKIAQWNISFFKEEEVEYCCAEQYMMAKKALLFEDKELYDKIMNSNDPKEIQELGRLIKNFDNEIWDLYKFDIVVKGNYLKFSQNKNLKELLLSTQNTILVEASPFDCIWGVGLDINNPLILEEANWKGLNLLGKALMKVRKIIKKEEEEV